MSDDEEVYSEEESEEPARPSERRAPSKPIDASGLDEESQALLEANAAEREVMADEIAELRARSIQRKKEREEEEREAARKREEEEERRREEEEERKAKKMEEEEARRAKRNEQMAEFAKAANQKGPNFVISKKAKDEVAASGGGEEEGEGEGEGKMSREQLELEKQQILKQRIVPLEIDGFDDTKLKAKAESLHKQLLMLEGERYDLEKRFRAQQQDMLEMAEKARAQNQSGKAGGLKRAKATEDNPDRIQEKYSGAPAKIVMYSKFERQKDHRDYAARNKFYAGPNFVLPTEPIRGTRKVIWNPDSGLPQYVELGAADPAPASSESEPAAPAPEPEPAAEEAAEEWFKS